MRALFHSPYFDSLGGGELYVLTLIEAMQKSGNQIDLAWHEQENLRTQASNKFSLNLAPFKLVPSFFYDSLINRYSNLKKYDVVFSVSDGSLPWLVGSKINIIHFQVPFHNISGDNIVNVLKKKYIHHFISNSKFTKKFVDHEFNIESQVIYPPINNFTAQTISKTNQILYVGRFSTLLQNKGHVQLIKAFKKLYSGGIKDYRLVLAGSTEVGSDTLIKEINSNIKEFPIDIHLNPSFDQIKRLYQQSRFYWSLAGVDVDEELNPEKCEHFGMSLVEAMSAGCIPLVINKGGFKEIITNKSGYLITSIDELVGQTHKLISNSPKQKMLSKAAILRSQDFSKQVFINSFKTIIPNL